MFTTILPTLRAEAASLRVSIENLNSEDARIALDAQKFDLVCNEVLEARTRVPSANAPDEREAADTIAQIREDVRRVFRLRLDRRGFDGGTLADVLRAARRAGHEVP